MADNFDGQSSSTICNVWECEWQCVGYKIDQSQQSAVIQQSAMFVTTCQYGMKFPCQLGAAVCDHQLSTSNTPEQTTVHPTYHSSPQGGKCIFPWFTTGAISEMSMATGAVCGAQRSLRALPAAICVCIHVCLCLYETAEWSQGFVGQGRRIQCHERWWAKHSDLCRTHTHKLIYTVRAWDWAAQRSLYKY